MAKAKSPKALDEKYREILGENAALGPADHGHWSLEQPSIYDEVDSVTLTNSYVPAIKEPK